MSATRTMSWVAILVLLCLIGPATAQVESVSATAPEQATVEVTGETEAQPVPVEPLSRPVEELLQDLTGGRPRDRVAAAWELARAGTIGPKGVAGLTAALDSRHERLREAAAWALGSLDDPEAREAVKSSYDTGPERLDDTRPDWPRAAFVAKLQGTVHVRILIGSNGSVVHAQIVESIPGLDEAALACVRLWTFKPAARNGRPIPTSAEAPVRWHIF